VHADLSRWIFRPDQHYSRAVVQQGRVSLDSDANAQASILLHYLRTLAADLIGEFGGPNGNQGFLITGPDAQANPSLTIGLGRYYVEGLLCEADGKDPIDYFGQPDGYGLLPALPPAKPYLVWLKVWERFISAVEDPGLREVALGVNGPDTTGRTRLVWQVLASPWPKDVAVPDSTPQAFYGPDGPWLKAVPQLYAEPGGIFAEPTGTLMAQAVPPQAAMDACTLSPDSGYRGPENQLYRVEIHRDGTASATAGTTSPTFTWSRENGSVTVGITGITAGTPTNPPVVSVTTLGRDPKLSIDVGNYVEIIDDAYASQGAPGPFARYAEPLHRVTVVDPVNLTVTLDQALKTGVGQDPTQHRYLRRWDQDEVLVTKAKLLDATDQAIDIVTGAWIDLEDGVQVQFSDGTYRAGDYWLIPARVVTGDVEWPTDDNGQALPLPPEGVRYHIAPLAVVRENAATLDVRLGFPPGIGVVLTAPDAAEAPEASPAPPPRARTSRSRAKSSGS
jgi:Family of unknown function (DUF6519)